LGDESKYSVVCRTFMELVFEENDVERGFNFEEDDMLAFFASFASKTPIDLSMDSGSSNVDLQTQKLNYKQALSELLNELGFISTMIYCGYIDDPRNTDVCRKYYLINFCIKIIKTFIFLKNAWIEAEIWNFHFDKDDYFDTKIKNPGSKWREVSSNVRIHSNEIIGDSLKEITEIHNAFYS
jgi:hypothetical protein